MTIQFESHRVELAGIYEMEHDDSVFTTRRSQSSWITSAPRVVI